jgi:Dyp-type peroxidase family
MTAKDDPEMGRSAMAGSGREKGRIERDAGEIQGIVFTGYGTLPAARYVLLEIADATAFRAWLRASLPRITPGGVRAERQACNIAFTAAGLRALGLRTVDGEPGPADEQLVGFSREFREGMTWEARQRALGDQGRADPRNWLWGGPSNSALHALVFLFAADDGALAELDDELFASPGAAGLASVVRLEASAAMMRSGKEHFGFDDGITQPIISGYKEPEPPRPANTLAPGEVILGYENQYGARPESPLVAAADDPAGLLPEARSGGPPGARDLGCYGSYLVVRQLRQDVAGFWRWAEKVAAALRQPAPAGVDPRVWVAAKMLGRWPDGTPMTLSPDRPLPDMDPRRRDAFAYRERDAGGMSCPIGSHIRRANPRDALPGSVEEAMAVASHHRILRRGRAYGEPLANGDPDSRMNAESGRLDPLKSVGPDRLMKDRADPDRLMQDDGEDRGLYFICLNADIARQFELIQQTWLNNAKFDGLYADPDPVAAGHPRPPTGSVTEATRRRMQRNFTFPRRPVRERCTEMPLFVTPVGGAYFFLPGMRALQFLAAATARPDPT